MMRNPFLGLSVVVALAATPPASGQASPTASVRGVVVDSTTAAPLADARVVLWGTPHEASTDEAGRFRIPDVPAGDYSLVFFHPRLAELGVASGGHAVRVGGDDVRLELGVPSRFTLLSTTCAGSAGVTVAGRVEDAGSGLPLAGVTVTFRFLGSDDEPEERQAETGGEGWYHACGLPAGRGLAVGAAFLDRQAPRREIRAPDGAAVRLDLPLARLRSSRLTAHVTRNGSGEPVADARVRLGVPGARRSAGTDRDGRAVFDGVPPGRYTLEVEHLAHAPRTDSVDVPSGMDVAIRLDLAEEPIPLPPIDVMVEGFDETLDLMGGIEVTPAEIEAVRARSRDLGDLLHNQYIPGVIVKRGFSGDACIEFLTGQVRMFKRTCEPVMVILDGVRMSVARDVFSMPATVIESLRLFRPIEAGTLFGLGSGSGVLVITTKGRD